MRGMTSASTGETPIVRIASISSVIFIVPSLGGEGGARTAGDHDRRHQHAELAYRDAADEVDGVYLGAELGELHRALLRDDDADKEAHQPDDAECANADHIEARDDRIEPEFPGTADNVGETDQRRAEEAEQAKQRPAGLGNPLAELDQQAGNAGRAFRANARWLVEVGDFLEQAGFVPACADNFGVPVADRAVDDPRADRIHTLDFAEVDRDRIGQCVDLALRGRGAGNRQRPRDPVDRAVASVFVGMMPLFRHSRGFVREMRGWGKRLAPLPCPRVAFMPHRDAVQRTAQH